jgi:hypothetical protein
MAGISFYKRPINWFMIIASHPLGIGIGFLLSLLFGFYIGKTWVIITPLEPLKLLGVIAAALSGVIITVFSTIKGVYDLEIKDRELTKLEKQDDNINQKESDHDEAFLNKILKGIRTYRQFYKVHEEDRTNHWRYEKEFLAKKMVAFLKRRIAYIKSSKEYNKIAILFDAGSTITPILDMLGSQASDEQNHWTSDPGISIYTNNLNGVLTLLKYRDFDEKDDRHANIPFKCSVLPGDVLSAYAATASENTIQAINDIRSDESTYIIAVSTGNYVFLNLNKKHIAPIARTGKHPDIKSALATTANEIYYVAPLGKVILCRPNEKLEELRDRFNSAMNFMEKSERSSERPYKLSFECASDACFSHKEWHSKSILVTTNRTPGNYFTPHSNKVNSTTLTTMGTNTSIPLDEGPLIFSSKYQTLPPFLHKQKQIDIPHKYLHGKATDFFDTNEPPDELE